MATFGVLIFAADNLTNPQNPGFFPAEDNSHRSDLQNGDQLTWNGGGESAFIEIDDPSGTSFDDMIDRIKDLRSPHPHRGPPDRCL